MIDGGGLVGSPVDTGERVVAPMLRARRRDALALAILTHPLTSDVFGFALSGEATALRRRAGSMWTA